MRRYSFFEPTARRLVMLFYLCAALYLSRESMYNLYIWGFYPSQFAFLGITAAMGGAFLWMNRKNLPELMKDRRVIFAAGAAALVLLPMILKRDWQFMYFSVLICIFISVFLSLFSDLREISRLYLVLMTVLGAYSAAATYLLRIPADRGILPVPVFYNAFDAAFYDFFLSTVSLDFVKNRNFGIFREPGVYQFFLMVGLYLNNDQAEWEDKRVYWLINAVLSVTMLTTFATGGVLSLGLFVVLVYVDRKWYRTRQGRILAAAAVGVVLAVIAFIVIQQGELYMELYRMLEKFGNGSDSITDRVGSPVANMKLLLSSPLWGRGLDETLHIVDNNTSSSTILFAILGVVGGSLNVAGWFALVWKKSRGIVMNLLLLAVLAVAFNTQNLITNLFFWLFPMMAIMECWLPKLNKKE